jgi:hypothetical protein
MRPVVAVRVSLTQSALQRESNIRIGLLESPDEAVTFASTENSTMIVDTFDDQEGENAMTHPHQYSLNRSAVLLRPTQALLDWLLKVSPEFG